jgi:hypothetical protein
MDFTSHVDLLRQNEETPLLPSATRKKPPKESLLEQAWNGSADTSILVDHRRQITARRRGMFLTFLFIIFMAMVLFDGVGHNSISWLRSCKDRQCKKKHHKKTGSWTENTGMMLQDLVRKAQRSFSKVVIVLVNDQGDDDDRHKSVRNAPHEEKQQKYSRNTNDDDYIDDDSVKKKSTKQDENDAGDQGSYSADTGDDSECDQKDWKCWRDKYIHQKTELRNESNRSDNVTKTETNDDHADDKDKSVKGSVELEGMAHIMPTSMGERGIRSRSKSDKDKSTNVSEKVTDIKAKASKSTNGKEEAAKELEKLDQKKSEGISYCQDGKYSKRTLKLAYEMPFQGLFRDTKQQQKFEASSVVVVDSMAYAICDSSWSISMFDPCLHPFGEHNHQIGDPNREPEDSGYEALFYDNHTFFVVRESVKGGDQTYHAVIEELLLDPEVNHESYGFGRACPTEFQFEGDSKGFEGATPVHDLDGDLVVLGLCEGNHCSQSKGLKDDKGNGRLVAMKLTTRLDGSCEWSTIRTIKIPDTAYFGDYSSIDMDLSGRVMISSQEESQLWIGQLDGIQPNGLWNVTGMEFRKDKGMIFDFPKNSNCETIYCNIEGVHWVDEYTILAVSDKMKSKGGLQKCSFW